MTSRIKLIPAVFVALIILPVSFAQAVESEPNALEEFRSLKAKKIAQLTQDCNDTQKELEKCMRARIVPERNRSSKDSTREKYQKTKPLTYPSREDKAAAINALREKLEILQQNLARAEANDLNIIIEPNVRRKPIIESDVRRKPISESVYAGTDSKRWEGFRGLRWATNINDIDDPNIILIQDNNELKVYRRISDKLSIGDAKLEEITYIFYKDRFCGLTITAKGYTNFTALKDAVFAYYGEGKQENKYIKEWFWWPAPGNSNKDIIMILKHNESSEATKLFMYYSPIIEEQKADDAKKAKEAGKDF
jgi:hypothetical protein